MEWTRTITELPPPAPQAGASTNSATTASSVHNFYAHQYILKSLQLFFQQTDYLTNTHNPFFQAQNYYFCVAGAAGELCAGAAGAGTAGADAAGLVLPDMIDDEEGFPEI